MKISKQKLIKLFLLIIILFLIPQISKAQTACADRYTDGYCAEACSPDFNEDPDTSLCIKSKEKCCHKLAATADLQLQVPLLGYTRAKDITEYIAKIYEASLYIIVPVIIVVIIFSGILWVLAGGDKQLINKAKSRILHGFIGLGIALFSYVLLSFVGITEIGSLNVQSISPIQEIPNDLYYGLINSEPFSLDATGEEIIQWAVEVSNDVGIHPCVMKTILKKESGGKPNAIGHDENARLNISARKKFVSSGKKYSGATFSPTGIKAKVFNDDKNICNSEDLCLDWRFSHGIGLGQLTIFPGNFCAGTTPSRKFSGKCLTAKELLHPRGNLEGSARLWKANFRGGDYRTAFRKYNGSGSAAETYADSAMQIFRQCCAQEGGC